MVTPIVENNVLFSGTTGSFDINTSSGEHQCNGSPQTGKINGPFCRCVQSDMVHVAGQWTLVNEKNRGRH